MKSRVVLDPLDFIARIAALVPRPRLDLNRFHGVFAPQLQSLPAHRAKARTRTTKVRQTPTAHDLDAARKRVFAIDTELYPKCGGKLHVIACIDEPGVIAKILEHIRARRFARWFFLCVGSNRVLIRLRERQPTPLAQRFVDRLLDSQEISCVDDCGVARREARSLHYCDVTNHGCADASPCPARQRHPASVRGHDSGSRHVGLDAGRRCCGV